MNLKVTIMAALIAKDERSALARDDPWLDDLVKKIMSMIAAGQQGAEAKVNAMSLALMNAAAQEERAGCTAMMLVAAEAALNPTARDTYRRAALLLQSREEPIGEDICYSFSDCASTIW